MKIEQVSNNYTKQNIIWNSRCIRIILNFSIICLNINLIFSVSPFLSPNTFTSLKQSFHWHHSLSTSIFYCFSYSGFLIFCTHSFLYQGLSFTYIPLYMNRFLIYIYAKLIFWIAQVSLLCCSNIIVNISLSISMSIILVLSGFERIILYFVFLQLISMLFINHLK